SYFLYNHTTPPDLYTLSLHDALPIYPFPYPEKPIERGKVLVKADLDKLGTFSRYKDVDGDGIGYRTLPGTQHPAAAYFTRGSGQDRKSTRLNSSHRTISYAVFCLKKK